MGVKMNNEQLARLKAISGKDSYLYQLAQKDALNELKTAENDILDPESMQERADEIRKDDSEPEPDFLDGVQVCRIDDPDCEACQ